MYICMHRKASDPLHRPAYLTAYSLGMVVLTTVCQCINIETPMGYAQVSKLMGCSHFVGELIN